MRFVRADGKRYPGGCGQVCLAMLAGLTFKQALERVPYRENGLSWREMPRYLHQVGLRAPGYCYDAALVTPARPRGMRVIKSHPEFFLVRHTTLLLLCSQLNWKGASHYVVMHRGVIYDPLCGKISEWPWYRTIDRAMPVWGVK